MPEATSAGGCDEDQEKENSTQQVGQVPNRGAILKYQYGHTNLDASAASAATPSCAPASSSANAVASKRRSTRKHRSQAGARVSRNPSKRAWVAGIEALSLSTRVSGADIRGREPTPAVSKAHYVGYVEDFETPEMIMAKFAQLEQFQKELERKKQSQDPAHDLGPKKKSKAEATNQEDDREMLGKGLNQHELEGLFDNTSSFALHEVTMESMLNAQEQATAQIQALQQFEDGGMDDVGGFTMNGGRYSHTYVYEYGPEDDDAFMLWTESDSSETDDYDDWDGKGQKRKRADLAQKKRRTRELERARRQRERSSRPRKMRRRRPRSQSGAAAKGRRQSQRRSHEEHITWDVDGTAGTVRMRRRKKFLDYQKVKGLPLPLQWAHTVRIRPSMAALRGTRYAEMDLTQADLRALSIPSGGYQAVLMDPEWYVPPSGMSPLAGVKLPSSSGLASGQRTSKTDLPWYVAPYDPKMHDEPLRFDAVLEEKSQPGKLPGQVSVQDFAKLSIPEEVLPVGLLFIWTRKELIPAILDVVVSWGFRYVENLTWIRQSLDNELTADGAADSRYFQVAHTTLLIVRRNTKAYLELRHQRSPDVIFDYVRRPMDGGREMRPRAVYDVIETMLPHARYNAQTNCGRFLHLWAHGEQDCRAGWTTVKHSCGRNLGERPTPRSNNVAAARSWGHPGA